VAIIISLTSLKIKKATQYHYRKSLRKCKRSFQKKNGISLRNITKEVGQTLSVPLLRATYLWKKKSKVKYHLQRVEEIAKDLPKAKNQLKLIN